MMLAIAADTAMTLPPLTTIHWLVLFTIWFLGYLALDRSKPKK